jgi:folate-binding protein YgfZ
MFVLRAKCKLSDASADWPLWGLAGTGAVPGLARAAAWTPSEQADAHCVALPPARLGPVEVPRWLWAGPTPPAAADLPGGTWAALEALSGTPRVMAATSEQFVPQMVNLDLVDGVNFKKGCYPGQEVVARSQYRGTLKRRGAILLGTATMHPGQEIVHSADPGQPAGLVALAGDGPGLGPVAFAELKLAALEGGSLHLGSAEGPSAARQRTALPRAHRAGVSAELFIYWRTSAQQVPQALAAVQGLQRIWRRDHPGLRAQVYLRQDDAAAERTLMETYAHPAGLPPALAAGHRERSHHSLAPWCQGQRHVEVFAPADDVVS